MASSMSNANVVKVFANYYNAINNMDVAEHNDQAIMLIRDLIANTRKCLDAIITDGGYTVNFSEPRYTITPFGRPYKVKAGGSLSYTLGKTGGELNSAAVWSGHNFPSWMSINSGTGALTGTVPALTSYTLDPLDCVTKIYNLFETFNVDISCKNDFGEAVNGMLKMPFKIVHASTPAVSSGATGSGVHAGALTKYTIAANNTPTSFVAYGLDQLNAGTSGTVALNPANGEITGNCGSATVAGEYKIYVAAINEYGEGVDKEVTITLS